MKVIYSFAVFLIIHFLSGCSMINGAVDERAYNRQIKEPIAKKYNINIDGKHRNYFLVRSHRRNTENVKNKHLILLLAGSGCGDEQPLLGFLYQGIPVNADIAVIQKIGVRNGTRSDTKACPKLFFKYNNYLNRLKDNLALLQYLKKNHSYERITLLGVSEGVHIAYLMLNKDNSLKEAVLLANHVATSIKKSYDIQVPLHAKTDPKADSKYQKMLGLVEKGGNDWYFQYGQYLKNWRVTFEIDKRNMGEVLSKRHDVRYLFIMGDEDNYVSSKTLKDTNNIFCRNSHKDHLILYKNKTDHIVMRSPRHGTYRVIVDWLDNKQYQNNSDFTELSCKKVR